MYMLMMQFSTSSLSALGDGRLPGCLALLFSSIANHLGIELVSPPSESAPALLDRELPRLLSAAFNL